MQCANCQTETRIGIGYALPRLVRADTGYRNLYACSRACRDAWLANQHKGVNGEQRDASRPDSTFQPEAEVC